MREDALVAALLERHGRTYADELNIDVARNTPSPLFRLLCAALLFSARIRAETAVAAADALAEQGWTTAEKLAASSWEERAKTLNEAGYARYDERTATMLGDTADMALERYRGDLRRLREEAEREPGRERELLKDFKGIGDAGVDVFFREVQAAWDELYPFADPKALGAADSLGLPADAEGLAALVSRRSFPRLTAALVRMDLADDQEAVQAAAQDGSST